MAKMIPNEISPDIKSNAERRVFEWFQNAAGTDKWIVLHSLGISAHQRVIHGETDFLVLAPNLGIFALEIKGGRVQRRLGKWRYINKYGESTEKVRGPFDQAWEGIYSIRNSIITKLDIKHQYLKNIVFGIGVVFPDIEYASVGADEEQWQVFDIDDGNDIRKYIERISEGAVRTLKRLGYASNDRVYPSESDVNYLGDLLRGDFDQDVPLRIKQKYAEDSLLTLTREQSNCIEQLYDNPRALIRGTAGTGKTLLAIEAVKQAVSRGERVAFFCYNRLLGDWLRAYFADFPIMQQPMYVGTFHSYMKRLLTAKGIKVEEPSESAQKTEFFQINLPELVIKTGSVISVQYDRIIIDEAQDLISSKYLDIMELSIRNGLRKGNWIMFGDFSMQAIFNGKLEESDYLDMVQDRAFFALFRLKRNCRNTKKICLDIENIIGIPENAAFEDTIDNPAVNHISYTDEYDQRKKLTELLIDLLNNGIKRQDIVILSPYKREDSIVAQLAGIDIVDYQINSVGKIRFSTLQAFKGLESSVVILTDITNYDDEKLIYVGLSRARFYLCVLETMEATRARVNLFYKRRLANG